ncbi:hypothetical protein FACS1894130_05760 [Spirochaetia bacterium]|nr:hypothetical protein FACS1894130_05760 [Spirochaetia bacterium]
MHHKSFVITLIFAAWILGPLNAQDLSVDTPDIRIEQRVDGGYHLFIRKKPDIGSVLITESTRDPTMTADNYAYRSPTRNAVNGDEIRYLDGSPIPPEAGINSLIDSTPETHPELGEAFHIYIPYILNYGYPETRHGEVYVVDETYLNIRAFALPYADYRSSFRDNPFILRVAQKPLEGPPEGNYMKDTVDTFTDIVKGSQGDLIYSNGPDDLVDAIKSLMEKEAGETLDLVICLDTTSSMKDDIDAVRELLIPMLEATIGNFPDFRLGMVLYKDYREEYITRIIPFTRDFAEVKRSLNAIRVGGGRDIPEAVNEALYDAAVKFPWEATHRSIILIGDAPPHPRPRGEITKDMVDDALAERDVTVSAIVLPQ